MKKLMFALAAALPLFALAEPSKEVIAIHQMLQEAKYGRQEDAARKQEREKLRQELLEIQEQLKSEKAEATVDEEEPKAKTTSSQSRYNLCGRFREQLSRKQIAEAARNSDLILSELKMLRYEILLLKNELIVANVITNTDNAAVIAIEEAFRK